MICPNEQVDGFGSQFQTIISAIVYAELNNLEYIHRTIEKMEHNYTNDIDFIKRINECMNIDKKYRLLDKITKEERNKIVKPKLTFKQYFDTNFEKCYTSESLERIRIKYNENKPSKNEFFLDKNVIHISIHVRRPNSHDNRGSPSYDNQYIDLIKKLNQEYNTKGIIHYFHIMSQGKIEDFKNYTELNSQVILHLNELPEIAFHRMVISDILMTNASSYSYTAALLSKGIIYYKKFWHNGSKNWIHF